MKRFLLTFVSLVAVVAAAFAVPALPKVVRVMQPDGTYVSIRLVGDEYLHFNTTEDGYTVVKDSRGFYVYAQKGTDGQLAATKQVAHDEAERQPEEVQFLSGIAKWTTPAMTKAASEEKQAELKRQARARDRRRDPLYDYNNFKGLVILVEFNDKSFSIDDYHSFADDMMNKENYTGYRDKNGRNVSCTGSVRDYFRDQSLGQFEPQFDVFGPYQIDFSQYAANGTSGSSRILRAAVDAANADIDFTDYDRDGDGVVDMIYFIFAGNASSYSGNDSRLLWPHRSVLTEGWNYMIRDNVILYDYACSVELYGWTSQPSTVTLDGIGTICHEFGHVLGLPDLYDTDYEQGGGQSKHPGDWSVMSGGSYFNNGRTPVGYNLYERYAVGFTVPQLISETGSYELDALHESNAGLRIDSPVKNEYFLLENRQQVKWDQYLPGHGMLIFRVDSTSARVWQNNTVNANPNHNYFELVRARGTSSAASYDPFPGRGNVTKVNNVTSPANLKTWSGKDTRFGLLNIKETGGKISFDVEDTYILRDLTLPETYTVHIGNSRQLPFEALPDYAVFELTWSSSDESVATVDEEGRVTGVSVGTATISVESNNGLTASCLVSVQQPPQALSFASLKSLGEGAEAVLSLHDVQVLYSYKDELYLRDATGALVLKGSGLTVEPGNELSGSLYGTFLHENKMPVMSISDVADVENVKIGEGSEVEPRKVVFGDLTEADYADLIEVQGVELMRGSGVFAVQGDSTARLYNKFGIRGISAPRDTEGKVFDVLCIYGTGKTGDEILNELYLMQSPTEAIPAAIVLTPADADRDGERSQSADIYDLQGRRVGAADLKRGIYIQGNRKILVR